MGDVRGDGRAATICGVIVVLAGLGRMVPARKVAGWLRGIAALALLAGLAMAVYGWQLLDNEGYLIGWGVKLLAGAAVAGLVLVAIDALRRAPR